MVYQFRIASGLLVAIRPPNTITATDGTIEVIKLLLDYITSTVISQRLTYTSLLRVTLLEVHQVLMENSALRFVNVLGLLLFVMGYSMLLLSHGLSARMYTNVVFVYTGLYLPICLSGLTLVLCLCTVLTSSTPLSTNSLNTCYSLFLYPCILYIHIVSPNLLTICIFVHTYILYIIYVHTYYVCIHDTYACTFILSSQYTLRSSLTEFVPLLEGFAYSTLVTASCPAAEP